MRRLVAAGALALALALVAPGPAVGAYDPISSGGTTVRLGRDFTRLLDSNGVELVAGRPATLRGKAIFFPVAGGKLDSQSGAGTVEHEGSLVLRSAKGSIALRALKLRTTQRRAPLSAKLGGSQLKLFSAVRLTATRVGFGVKLETQGLRLSAKVATRLGKKLGLRGVFAAGQGIGRSLTFADPATVALRGGSVAFAPDPAFMAKLDARFVAANPIFPVERTGVAFTLPIAGGSIAPDASNGIIQSAGSLELLQLGGGQIFWRDAWLDFSTATLSAELEVEPSPPYAGKVGRTPIATLGPAPTISDPQKQTISAPSIALALSSQAAAALNQAFAQDTPVFAPGEPLGSISFVAQAR